MNSIKSNKNMESHYDQKYFDWQKRLGQIAMKRDHWKFNEFIKAGDVVLDFGCGGGCLRFTPGFLGHPMCFIWTIITDVKQEVIVAGKL